MRNKPPLGLLREMARVIPKMQNHSACFFISEFFAPLLRAVTPDGVPTNILVLCLISIDKLPDSISAMLARCLKTQRLNAVNQFASKI